MVIGHRMNAYCGLGGGGDHGSIVSVEGVGSVSGITWPVLSGWWRRRYCVMPRHTPRHPVITVVFKAWSSLKHNARGLLPLIKCALSFLRLLRFLRVPRHFYPLLFSAWKTWPTLSVQATSIAIPENQTNLPLTFQINFSVLLRLDFFDWKQTKLC